MKKAQPNSLSIIKLAVAMLAGAASCYGQMASQQPRGRDQPPIAMSALPSGVLTVLGVRGKLSLIRTDTGVTSPIKETLGYYSPADMAAAHIADRDLIFVTMYSLSAFAAQQSVARRGLITQYALNGEPIQTWPALSRAFDGIAVDAAQQLIYLGDGVSGEISTLSLQQSARDKGPKFLVEVAGISRLGSLALDPDRQRLFAADVGKGRIYLVDLARRKSRVLVSSLGEPAALAYDSTKRKLYIVDAARRCIWQVSVDDKSPKATVLSSAPELREPRGVAIDSDHKVWVADFGAVAVFKLGPKGQVIQKLLP